MKTILILLLIMGCVEARCILKKADAVAMKLHYMKLVIKRMESENSNSLWDYKIGLRGLKNDLEIIDSVTCTEDVVGKGKNPFLKDAMEAAK
mgnify:CR=1 FL=1